MLLEKFVPSVEVNSIQKNIKPKNEGVEIFSAICSGKDLTKYGEKVDKVVAYMKDLGGRAVAGDAKAMAEVNAIREIQIQTPLVKRLNIFSFMGDFHSVGFNEELRFKTMQFQGKMSGQQADSGSFAFPTQTWREGTMSTKTISGGIAINYREVATMNTDSLAQSNEQIMTDMLNQMFYDIVLNLYTSISAKAIAGGLTAFSEAGGINKAALDDAVKLIRRWGMPTISGDFSAISQIESFASFTTTAAPATVVQFSEAVMNEIMATGLLKNYRGVPIVEIPNIYNLTKINPTGGIGGAAFYDTMLPEGLLFLTPKSINGSALQVGTKGGITSQSGQDLNLGLNVQRFDMVFGSTVIPEKIVEIGLISDSNFTVDKY